MYLEFILLSIALSCKTKDLFAVLKPVLINNLNIGLEHFVLRLLINIYSIYLYVPILVLIVTIILHYLELIKVQPEYKVLHQLLQMFLLCSQQH